MPSSASSDAELARVAARPTRRVARATSASGAQPAVVQDRRLDAVAARAEARLGDRLGGGARGRRRTSSARAASACTSAASAAASSSDGCASISRTSTVPSRGCARTSHQMNV